MFPGMLKTTRVFVARARLHKVGGNLGKRPSSTKTVGSQGMMLALLIKIPQKMAARIERTFIVFLLNIAYWSQFESGPSLADRSFLHAILLSQPQMLGEKQYADEHQ